LKLLSVAIIPALMVGSHNDSTRSKLGMYGSIKVTGKPAG